MKDISMVNSFALDVRVVIACPCRVRIKFPNKLGMNAD